MTAAGCGPLSPDAEGIRYRSGGDIVEAATVVAIADTVDGDVMAAGRIVRFSGSSDGSYLGLGADQEITGRLGRDLRAAGGRVVASGATGNNVTAVGGEILFDDEAEAAGNVYLAGARVEQRGTVGGHLRIAAREVVLDGAVRGDVDVIAGSLTLGPFARIEGNLTYRTPEEAVRVDAAARVEGDVTVVVVSPPSLAPAIAFRVMRALAFLLVGVVFLLVFPGLRKAAPSLERRPWAGMGLGLLWLIAIPVLVGAAFVTVVGIPLAVIGAVGYAVALYAAPVVPGLWLGRRLLDRPGEPASPPWKAFLAGGSILAVVMLLPWVRFAARLAATAAGFGGVALAVRARLDLDVDEDVRPGEGRRGPPVDTSAPAG